MGGLKMKRILEISAYTIDAALAAQRGDADRVELCDGLLEGGTTPSYGTLKIAKELIEIPLVAIIRPRGGDFLYSTNEFKTMKYDVDMCRDLGIDGIAIGILNEYGDLDTSRMEILIKAAESMSVTCHRAFDMCRNPLQTMEQLIALGVDRILTSGMQPSAPQGKRFIKELIEKANNRIGIMPGAGINELNIESMATCTGATEFHSSAKLSLFSDMKFRNASVKMHAEAGKDEYSYQGVNVEKVHEMKRILNEL